MYRGMRPERILIVDDAIDFTSTLKSWLQKAGYQVFSANSGEQALTTVRHAGLPDLVLLEVDLPDTDGFTVAETLLQLGDLPIVFLSGISDIQTKITGLSQYGEDYLTKPIDYNILLARIRRILRRYQGNSLDTREVQIGQSLRASFDMQYVITDGAIVKLTPIENRLLEILYRHQGKVVPIAYLLTHSASIDALYVHIRCLREKIEFDPSAPRHIQTVRGKGYYLA